jgi:hypothetical protein
MTSFSLRQTGFGLVIQARSSQAKAKPAQDAGRVNVSAEDPRTRELGRMTSGHVTARKAERASNRNLTCLRRERSRSIDDQRERRRSDRLPTEDAGRQRFAAARTAPESTSRTLSASQGKTLTQQVKAKTSGGAGAKKKRPQASQRRHH